MIGDVGAGEGAGAVCLWACYIFGAGYISWLFWTFPYLSWFGSWFSCTWFLSCLMIWANNDIPPPQEVKYGVGGGGADGRGLVYDTYHAG